VSCGKWTEAADLECLYCSFLEIESRCTQTDETAFSKLGKSKLEKEARKIGTTEDE
jgi:hypothetical protein